MRRVHIGLIVVILAVAAAAYFERPPALEDFDPERHAEFRETWDKRLHISYWEKWGSFERDACQAMVDEFNRRQDEVFVHYVNASQVDRKAMLAIIGNDPPDVVGLWSQNVCPFAEADALVPLDDLMESSGLSREYYTDNYLRVGMYRGRVYALPTTPAVVALYYNKQHFRRKAAELKAAGLDPDRAPRTIAELDRYADVLSEFDEQGNPLMMGFLQSEPGWFNSTWVFYFGGELFDEEAGRVTTDKPENIRAYAWIKRYAERYGREKMLRFRSGFGNFDSPQNAFIDGKLSMEMQGVWFSNFIRHHRPHMEFGVAPFPCAEGVPGPRSYLEADVIAIPRGCKHPEAAWKFVHYVQTDGLAIVNRLQGKHMPIKHPPELFHQGHPNLELPVFEKIAASPHSFLLPRLNIWQEYEHELSTAFDHIWTWPVPEAELKGLTGEARQKKVEELCRAEIVDTLRKVREIIQKRYDKTVERRRVRGAESDR